MTNPPDLGKPGHDLGRAHTRTCEAHPADGLYFTTAARLLELRACWGGVSAFHAAAGLPTFDRNNKAHDTTVVPITLSLLMEVQRRYSCMQWLLGCMWRAGYISSSERDGVLLAIGAAMVSHARPVMDALLVRAKREGLVSA